MGRWSELIPAAGRSCWKPMRLLASMVTLLTLVLSDLATLRRPRMHFLREFFVLKDGGLVSLDWARSQFGRRQRVNYSGVSCCWIVVIIPGRWICDSKISLVPTCQALIEQQHYPLIWNQRGRAGTPLTASGLPADASDLRQVIEYLNSKYPHVPLALMGFSHAASLVISYLGEYGSSAGIAAGIAVSPIWEAQHSAPLSTWIACKLKRWMLSLNSVALCCPHPLDALLSPNLRQMEKLLFQKLSTEEDSIKDVDDIAVPLLVIHYDDDPLAGQHSLPRQLFTLYPHLLLLTCPLGGHCGLMQRFESPLTLTDVLAGEFIREIHWFMVASLRPARSSNASRHRGESVGVHCRRYVGRPSCSSC